MTSRTDAQALARAQWIVDALREHCGWTAQLTPDTLAPYLVEEAAEVSETIERGELGEPLAAELGDVLFQLLLHARLGAERGDLSLAAIADALSEKLLRRNTHVFSPGGELLEHPDHDPAAAVRAWQAAKAAERAQRGAPDDALHGLPRSLSALALAQKALARRAARTGEGPADPGHAASGTGADARSDVPHERAASAHHVAPDSPAATRLGDDLLHLVRRASAQGVDAERALRDALRRELSTPPEGEAG